MPQRILKPAWEGIKSPITLKTLLLFLAVGFIVYITIRDERYIRASADRDEFIARNTEASRIALEGALRNSTVTDQSLKQTEEYLKVMVDVRNSIHNVAELLKINRAEQIAEHRAIVNGRRVPPKTLTQARRMQPCYELRPIEKKYGDAKVVVNTLIETKCP